MRTLFSIDLRRYLAVPSSGIFSRHRVSLQNFSSRVCVVPKRMPLLLLDPTCSLALKVAIYQSKVLPVLVNLQKWRRRIIGRHHLGDV